MEQAVKVYVPVLAAFREDGVMLPRRLRWEDGKVYSIDRVIDIRPAPALKSGGQGDRYTIEVQGRRSYLFFERGTSPAQRSVGRWFVEKHVYQ